MLALAGAQKYKEELLMMLKEGKANVARNHGIHLASSPFGGTHVSDRTA